MKNRNTEENIKGDNSNGKKMADGVCIEEHKCPIYYIQEMLVNSIGNTVIVPLKKLH